MKRILAVILLMCMFLCTACKSQNEEPSDGANNQTQQTAAGDAVSTEEPLIVTPLAEHVARAMEASSLLVNEDTVIIPGLGIVSMVKRDDPFEEQLKAYAKMDLQTIVEDPVTYMGDNQRYWEDEGAKYIYALTTNGDVYYGERLVMSGVERLIGTERQVFVITKDGEAYELSQAQTSSFWELSGKKTNQAASSFNGAWFADSTGALTFSGMGKQKEDVVSGDLTVFSQPLSMLIATEDSNGILTLAGMNNVGHVIAVGAMNEVLNGWGEMSYISAEDGAIAGLTPNGRILTAGEVYPQAASSWENIAGMKLFDEGIIAVDKNGNYYLPYYNEGVGYVMFNETGFVGPLNAPIELCLYSIDGREYYIDQENRNWHDIEGHPLVTGSLVQSNDFEAVAPSVDSTVAYNPNDLNQDSVESWLDEMLAGRKAYAEEQHYYYYTRFVDANGQSATQGTLSMLQISVNEEENPDVPFLNEVMLRVAQSGMLTKMTQGDIDKLTEAQQASGNRGYSVQLGNWYVNVYEKPFGGYMASFTME